MVFRFLEPLQIIFVVHSASACPVVVVSTQKCLICLCAFVCGTFVHTKKQRRFNQCTELLATAIFAYYNRLSCPPCTAFRVLEVCERARPRFRCVPIWLPARTLLNWRQANFRVDAPIVAHHVTYSLTIVCCSVDDLRK